MKKFIKFPVDLPISQAVIHSNWNVMDLAGLVWINEEWIVPEGIEKQTKLIMEEAKDTLEADGFTLNDIVKARIFMADLNDFDKMNEVYWGYFENWNYPARFALWVNELPLWALIEIEFTAVKN